MPIRNSLAITLTLAGAVACVGFFSPSQAQQARDLADDDDDAIVRPYDLKPRDLRPAPIKKKGRPHVTLRPSSPVVRIGSPISFSLSSSVRGYGHLYVMSASGQAQVWMENVPISAHRRLTFPIGRLGIRAAPPAGREDLMLIVTRDRIKGFFGYRTTRSPQVVDYDHKSFKRALTRKFVDLPRREWGYARTSVRVIKRLPSGWGWGPDYDPPVDYWADQWDDED